MTRGFDKCISLLCYFNWKKCFLGKKRFVSAHKFLFRFKLFSIFGYSREAGHDRWKQMMVWWVRKHREREQLVSLELKIFISPENHAFKDISPGPKWLTTVRIQKSLLPKRLHFIHSGDTRKVYYGVSFQTLTSQRARILFLLFYLLAFSREWIVWLNNTHTQL